MFSNLISSIVTIEDRNLMLSNLMELRASLASTSEEVRSGSLKAQLEDISSSSGQPLPQIINQLEDQLKALPICTLTLSYLPTVNQAKDIIHWIRAERKDAMVLKFVRDQSLLGGATIEWQGKYADYSLRRRLDHYWDSGKGKIHEQTRGGMHTEAT